MFAEAYADVEREFAQVFATLFPGGEGRLLLTDPDDMLTTGIEVEARPPGKKVKRLSLLSGGEKSLTAVAMLVAIFRARPSPFYVMDEVEAALDDVNLRRLIGLFEQLREQSQLIVITHQKPTMEIADALYGVTMRGDGITAVISSGCAARNWSDGRAPPTDSITTCRPPRRSDPAAAGARRSCARGSVVAGSFSVVRATSRANITVISVVASTDPMQRCCTAAEWNELMGGGSAILR